jgi:hypothetical protein
MKISNDGKLNIFKNIIILINSKEIQTPKPIVFFKL